MPKKQILSFIPHPDKVLVKITKESWESLFYKWIVRDDGSKCQLFTQLEESEGYDKRYTQNVSAGVIVAVGENIIDVYPSDIAILDYLATNNIDVLVGYINGDRLISVNMKTTYHEENSRPQIDGRKAYVIGDYDHVSSILGIIRNDKIIAFDPYVFLNHKSNLIVSVLPNGKIRETVEDISEREIISAPEGCGFSDGDTILVKEPDIFGRIIGGKEVSVIMRQDILLKK